MSLFNSTSMMSLSSLQRTVRAVNQTLTEITADIIADFDDCTDDTAEETTGDDVFDDLDKWIDDIYVELRMSVSPFKNVPFSPSCSLVTDFIMEEVSSSSSLLNNIGKLWEAYTFND